MKWNRNTAGLLFLGIETVLFCLVYFFLVFENMFSIFAVLSALVLLSVAINRFAFLSRIVKDGFSSWRIPSIVYGILFVLGMPVLLKDKPYQIFILFNTGLFAVLGLAGLATGSGLDSALRRRRSGMVSIDIPKALHEQLVAKAQELGVEPGVLIEDLLGPALGEAES